MERVSVEIERQDVADALREQAEAHGHSIEDELSALIERTYRPARGDRATRIRAMSGDEFVDHLIAVANGATLELPDRVIDPERDVFGAD